MHTLDICILAAMECLKNEPMNSKGTEPKRKWTDAWLADKWVGGGNVYVGRWF